MAKKTKSERLLSLAKRLSAEGDKENASLLKELAKGDSAGAGEAVGGLNDNEMSLLRHKLRSAIKPEAGEESEDE